jgi:hypothetical protein
LRQLPAAPDTVAAVDVNVSYPDAAARAVPGKVAAGDTTVNYDMHIIVSEATARVVPVAASDKAGLYHLHIIVPEAAASCSRYCCCC